MGGQSLPYCPSGEGVDCDWVPSQPVVPEKELHPSWGRAASSGSAPKLCLRAADPALPPAAIISSTSGSAAMASGPARSARLRGQQRQLHLWSVQCPRRGSLGLGTTTDYKDALRKGSSLSAPSKKASR